jgi:hypothetical protein
MKAKKIVTQTPAAPQAGIGPAVRPTRPTARVVHQTFNRITSDLDILQNTDASQSQTREAIKALFSIIEGAKYSLTRLTGAPGIISQIELEQFRAQDAAWNEQSFAVKMSVPRAPSCDSHDKLNERFEAGWLVEPGRFLMYRDRMGVIVIVDSVKEPRAIRAGRRAARAPHMDSAARPNRTARAPGIDAPTSAQLQAWFDLPSDQATAENLPIEYINLVLAGINILVDTASTGSGSAARFLATQAGASPDTKPEDSWKIIQERADSLFKSALQGCARAKDDLHTLAETFIQGVGHLSAEYHGYVYENWH